MPTNKLNILKVRPLNWQKLEGMWATCVDNERSNYRKRVAEEVCDEDGISIVATVARGGAWR